MSFRWCWAAAAASSFICLGGAFAADHRDGLASADPSTDLAELFAWMSPDKATLYLALTVHPDAVATSRFSTRAKYVFHVSSGTSVATQTPSADVIATFDAEQKVRLWVTRPNGADVLDQVFGDASGLQGLTSTTGKTRVFAGLRDDPAFFNQQGIRSVEEGLGQLAQGVQLDLAGCPTLDTGAWDQLVTTLKSGSASSAATNELRGKNVLAIVVALDKGMVSDAGSTLGVWAATHE